MKKNLKILHFGLLKTINPGIKQQLICEQKAPTSLNWHVTFFSHDPVNEGFMRQPAYPISIFKTSRLLKYLTLRISAYYWLVKHADEFDIIILRYPLGDPIIPLFFLRINNYLTIHHTKELHEINPRTSLVSRLQFIIESYAGKLILKKAKGVIGLTKEILEYELDRIKGIEKPGVVSANGVDTDLFPPCKDCRSGVIKLVILCSRAYPWHGIDIIKRELKINNRADVEIHVIGNLERTALGKDKRVIYHGSVKPNDLANILCQFDMGIGSLALQRNNMKEACILKTRDYLAAGLPVYATYSDSGLPTEFPYFINQLFSLNKAIELAKNFRKTSRNLIIKTSRPYIDKQAQIKKLTEWINQQPSFTFKS
ncbi:glycosyltransferase family protein [Alkalimarinus alittae]|uniref:Glycosyltransferase n=1 Tax=Alkalimarinus alittae TaxID=2961619 RepID=A0ABY6MZA8_9ALTE|nr:hypothetical protein [Alkalimarinus alittae]UZE95159.1 hypothetical protein NKI27_13930 [Alkalimarinus alittae]